MGDMELIFDIIIPLVIIPIFYFIKSHGSEIQRQGILLNKTREENMSAKKTSVLS
jgi:hypothetical protein